MGSGFAVFTVIAILALPLRLVVNDMGVFRSVIWWAGSPVLFGTIMVLLDIIFIVPLRRGQHLLMNDPVLNREMTVVLTAYNDELSIGEAVRDFSSHPLVKRVIVVDNNSTDQTRAMAITAGAIVVSEGLQGYGHCVFRALKEGAVYDDTDLVALCEGDLTFNAADLEKLLSYIAHADIVNGTRIVEQLRSPVTQLTTFMYWGNFGGAKLLEAKHLGRGTITDLGTTYKLCRTACLRQNLGLFDPTVNLEFNAHFIDTVLGSGIKLVEVPVCFFPRVGLSKGGNLSNIRAIQVGIGMLVGIVFSWRLVAKRGI